MVYLKLENTQVTGSFKVRGALNAVLSLDAERRTAGVVAASTGNHGAGVATRPVNRCEATIYVPKMIESKATWHRTATCKNCSTWRRLR